MFKELQKQFAIDGFLYASANNGGSSSAHQNFIRCCYGLRMLSSSKIYPKNKFQARPNSLSSKYGLECFPFHTDNAWLGVPPRFILLDCCKSETDVVTLVSKPIDETLLVAGRQVFCRSPHTGASSILRLSESINGNRMFRWDENSLIPIDAASEVRASNLKLEIETLYASGQEIILRVGDSLLIDNWRVLHARGRVDGPRNRVIDRSYWG